MRILRMLTVCATALGLAGCLGRVAPSAKVEFPLDGIDANGLRGPADGKVSVSYEFAIPDDPACRAEVARIDPSVTFSPGSRGRVGAGPGQVLCIGSTHGQDFRRVLNRLASLPYVTRIIECHFE